MDLNEIQAFVAVTRAGSFTAAAQRQATPKSTLSRQVSRLEERLGVQLLHRTTRKLGLTEAGQGYYARCVHAIETIENAERFALDLTDRPTGTLRVAMSYDMATLYVAPLLAEFHRRFPEVALDIDMSNRKVDLVEEGIDVALRAGILEDSNLIARRLGYSTLVLAAAPSYLDAHGPIEQPEDATGHRGLLLRQLVQTMGRPRLVGPRGPELVPLEPFLTCNDFAVLHRAARDGVGVGLLESNMVAPDLASGRLVRLLPEHELGKGGGLFAVYPATHHLTPKVRAFVDFVAEKLEPRFATASPDPPSQSGSGTQPRSDRATSRPRGR